MKPLSVSRSAINKYSEAEFDEGAGDEPTRQFASKFVESGLAPAIAVAGKRAESGVQGRNGHDGARREQGAPVGEQGGWTRALSPDCGRVERLNRSEFERIQILPHGGGEAPPVGRLCCCPEVFDLIN
eukprot:1195618-Prorocentrum_minimum.AAC.2